jgi:serine/threonine-protein kinase
MALSPGSRIGPYEIIAPLGAGGMGQVYRAKDTRLGRIVAIKAMHESVAQDPERVVRFQREAQLLASLNHPNIAAIHGVEELGGSRFLVLEFVDGRPLSDILQGGAPPFGDAMAIAKQIAGALATTHERGIIHRDLKPGNVMVTPDGQVKVLDFGLGKAIEGEASQAGEPGGPPANSPTMTMAATQAGIILGTAGYMSPEQAKGRIADKRSDVWAFGCVLFELLTGKRAFDGEDVTEILAAIVRGEPEWQALPATVPEPVRDLVHRCLIRNRTERIGDMSVVQFLLNERASGAMPVSPAKPTRAVRSIGVPMVAALVTAAVVVTAGVAWLWPRTAAPVATARLTRLSIALPESNVGALNLAPVAVSPDGSSVVYVGTRDNKTQLFLRVLAEPDAHALPGTENPRSPFFSPDGQWIAFFSQRKLKKITVGGTALQEVADAPDARGGAWGPDDMIYFAPTNVSGLWKAPAGGGAGTEFIPLDRTKGEVSMRWPQVLPGGQSLLFNVWTGPGPDEVQIVEQSLTSNERHELIKGGNTPRYVSPGFLTYGRLDQLFAVPWRPGQRDLSGVVPVTLSETSRLENEGSSDYSVSSDGTLVYVAGNPARLAQRIVWVDRTGKTESLPLPEREFESVSISPDGQQAVVQVQDAVIGLWIYDFARQSLAPFLATGASSQAPVWSHDGKRIIYRGTRAGFRNLYMKSADGTGPEVRLTTKERVIHTPSSVSPDGQWVVFVESGAIAKGGVSTSIWRVRLDGDRTPEPLLEGGELTGMVSPDGKWLAFMGASDPQPEIFIQPYPGPGARRQISIDGGAFPRWSRDGKELFFDTLDQNKMMAVTITSSPTLSVGTPHVVLEGRYRTSINANTPYDVSLDGRRFLRIQRVQPDLPVTKIEVVLNWFRELTRAGQK